MPLYGAIPYPTTNSIKSFAINLGDYDYEFYTRTHRKREFTYNTKHD